MYLHYFHTIEARKRLIVSYKRSDFSFKMSPFLNASVYKFRHGLIFFGFSCWFGWCYLFLCMLKKKTLFGHRPASGRCPIAVTTYMMICAFVHSHTLCARELKIWLHIAQTELHLLTKFHFPGISRSHVTSHVVTSREVAHPAASPATPSFNTA